MGIPLLDGFSFCKIGGSLEEVWEGLGSQQMFNSRMQLRTEPIRKKTVHDHVFHSLMGSRFARFGGNLEEVWENLGSFWRTGAQQP